MKRLLVSTFFFILIFQNFLDAQTDQLKADDCIRVTAIDHFYTPVKGNFQSLFQDTLKFSMQDKIFPIPISDLQKLERLEGKKSNVITGGIIGAVSGGLILGVLADSEKKDGEGFASVGQPGFPGGFLAGALAGVVAELGACPASIRTIDLDQ